jgi:hypothetical protein
MDSTAYLPPPYLVLTEGAHVAKKNEVTKKWNVLNDHFFNQIETQAFESGVVQEA